MRETRTSGSTSGKWNRNNAAPLLDSTSFPMHRGADAAPLARSLAHSRVMDSSKFSRMRAVATHEAVSSGVTPLTV